jgi:hypothetical protein
VAKATDNRIFEVHEPCNGKLLARVAAGCGRYGMAATLQQVAGWVYLPWRSSVFDRQDAAFITGQAIVVDGRQYRAG